MSGDVVQLLIESFPRILLPGLIMTIPLTLIAFAFALVIAVVVALIQYAHVPVLRQIARFYIWVIRGTPLLVQLMVGYYGPSTFGFHPNGFVVAIIVFAINEGAYCAETIRGSLESVPVGQMEAGYCVGMSYMQIMWHVVLPQAFRTAFPALSNSLIGMVKDTSLASNITVTEMFLATRQIAGRTYQFLPLYLEVAFIYLLFSTVMTWLQRLGEKKLGTYTAKRA
ncbi:MAG: amino acid ABC transporter permease [Lachnospiraceae bacterium]|nr:amino acid ABC transporter permease [Lachnospiraceae bacterium]MCH4028585.1 amino acid ABC transporter permease [Lachnospiraceae bacterium]MCH4066435.1 amino acid ABC transporter permease [Lachnospiraceae bacterium]MCH4112465.1 amino acid ABC transporter permease [Lachnospiraceae bacterium]MCI1353122.1 amino acid ABC transporter permease [Lachnospiraceae bacterium]